MRSHGVEVATWGRSVDTSSVHEFSTHLSITFHTGAQASVKGYRQHNKPQTTKICLNLGCLWTSPIQIGPLSFIFYYL